MESNCNYRRDPWWTLEQINQPVCLEVQDIIYRDISVYINLSTHMQEKFIYVSFYVLLLAVEVDNFE